MANVNSSAAATLHDDLSALARRMRRRNAFFFDKDAMPRQFLRSVHRIEEKADLALLQELQASRDEGLFQEVAV